ALTKFRSGSLKERNVEKKYLKKDGSLVWLNITTTLAELRRFEHFWEVKYLGLLELTPEGRHYSGVGGTGAAEIVGGGWAGSSSLSFCSNRRSSASGSVQRVSTSSRPSVVGRCTSIICIAANFSSTLRRVSPGASACRRRASVTCRQ